MSVKKVPSFHSTENYTSMELNRTVSKTLVKRIFDVTHCRSLWYVKCICILFISGVAWVIGSLVDCNFAAPKSREIPDPPYAPLSHETLLL